VPGGSNYHGPPDALKRYAAAVEGAGEVVKGAKNPYTSRNGHMFSFLDGDGAMALAGVLIETYGRYLNTPGSEPAADGVSFRQARLWLTDHELDALVVDVTAALARYSDFNKTHERTPRLLSTILMPEPVPTSDYAP